MRAAGVLLPVSALNGRHMVGDFGKEAYEFVDLISEAGFRIWQILPLNPLGYGNSPYQPYSSYAGDEIYISPDMLYKDGYLKKEPEGKENYDFVDYKEARKLKARYLKEAYENFKKAKKEKEYEEFSKIKWVYEYAVFLSLKKKNQMKVWNRWEKNQRDWIKGSNYDISHLEEEINYEIFVQYIFFRQWFKLKKYANEKNIKIMGDIPIYCGLDSQDVWKNRKCFVLSNRANPKFVAGVPPDYFSKKGQRWGNPIYDWENIKKDDFKFWVQRIRHNSKIYDIIRIDHFRGFDTYWAVKARNKTAMKGKWLEAPGKELFDKIVNMFPNLEIVAEDLGDLRKQVIKLRDRYNFKGMKVVQFCMNPKEKKDPFKDKKNMIIYTGTHDNQTIMGWYKNQDKETKKFIEKKFKKNQCDTENITNGFLEFTFKSKFDYAIVPLQDILGLGDQARINTPGTLDEKNWSYRFQDMEGLKQKINYLRDLIKDTNRI